jgi:hypothetical protein
MSCSLNVTFCGHVDGGGKVEGVMSKPVNWHVEGRLLATSKSQIPVPVPMSATLRVGEVVEMLGWIRKPRVLVVKKCCSSSLLKM